MTFVSADSDPFRANDTLSPLANGRVRVPNQLDALIVSSDFSKAT
jgi:hypothetical protein